MIQLRLLSQSLAQFSAQSLALAAIGITSLGAVHSKADSMEKAKGSRFIVQMKSPSAFSEAETALKRSLLRPVTRRDAFGRFTIQRPQLLNTTAKISQALENLDMLVIETQNANDIQSLRSNPNVEFVEQEQFIPLLEKNPLKPARTSSVLANDDEYTWGVKAVKAPEAWQTQLMKVKGPQSSMGAGARVVILDTGIDKDHPDLKLRLEAGKNFVNSISGDDPEPSKNLLLSTVSDVVRSMNLLDELATPPPYEYFDQEGHGTHVAGTIAGELDGKGVVGVAPRSKILMGRVCGKFGCSTVAIVNGINWAIAEKVDVISMSLGGPVGTISQERALTASDAAGIVNIAASGNSGNNAVSFPAAYDTCLAVGALDSTLKKAAFSQWGPELDVMGPGVDVKSSVPQGTGRDSKVLVALNGRMVEVPSTSFMGAPEIDSPMQGSLQFAGLGKTTDFAGKDFNGRIALISRGEIPFAEKVKNAIAAGAKAVMIFNNTAGLISGSLTSDGSVVAVPVVMIEQLTGEGLRDSLNTGRIENAQLATLKTDYAAFSGTSMATPHVAGVAALVKAINKNLSPAQVREILKSSATALEQTSDNQYGSGIVNAEAAVQAALKSL